MSYIIESQIRARTYYYLKSAKYTAQLAWENSRRFARSPLEPSQNDVWVTSAEIPYWWRALPKSFFEKKKKSLAAQPIRGTTKIRVVYFISMEFLRSLLRRRFARAHDQVATSRNVGCFLRLELSKQSLNIISCDSQTTDVRLWSVTPFKRSFQLSIQSNLRLMLLLCFTASRVSLVPSGLGLTFRTCLTLFICEYFTSEWD